MDKDILHRFFEGTASFQEEEAVCNWAEATDENRRELIRERKYFDVLLFHGKTSGEARVVKPLNLYPVLKDCLKVAAMLAIVLASALYIYTTIKPAEQVAMNRIIVPPGQRVNIILPDETSVWLNACSELVYPAVFKRDARTVNLKGEGYFDVKKDAKHPFIVQAGKHEVKVLGTKFNVEVNEADSIFSAALMEGSIQLTNTMNPQEGVVLSPHQKAEWKDSRFVVEPITNLDNYRWKEGLICFDNILFADLMKRFEKTYDIRILVRNKKLDTYRCSGKCRINDGIDFILQVLQQNARFTFSRNEDHTVLYID